MSKQRFLTIQEYDSTIHAFTEEDNYQDAFDELDVADWIWQFAESKEQAIAQHENKVDQWQREIDSGQPERGTY